MLLIKSGSITPQGKVIKKEAFSEILEAKKIIEKVSEESEELLKECKEKCKKLRKSSKEKGFKEGLSKFNDQIVYLDTMIKEKKLEMEGALIPIIMNSVKKIVGHEIETNPSIISKIVMDTIDNATNAKDIKLYLNESDMNRISREDIIERLTSLESLEISIDPNLSKGECILETESGVVNATLKNQLAALEGALKKFI